MYNIVGATMTLIPGYRWIEVVPDRRGGKPTIKGTRVAVDDVLDMLAAGWSLQEVAEDLDVPEEAIYEALRFASEAVRRVTVVVETSG